MAIASFHFETPHKQDYTKKVLKKYTVYALKKMQDYQRRLLKCKKETLEKTRYTGVKSWRM